MIVSGIDRYIASWFNILKEAKKILTVDISGPAGCVSTLQNFVNFYVYIVSVSDKSVTVKFTTNSTYKPQFLSMKFIGIYGQPDTCVHSYGVATLYFPFSWYQLITVFHV